MSKSLFYIKKSYIKNLDHNKGNNFKYNEDVYKLELIASDNGKDSNSVDENLFIHDGDKQVSVVGLISNPIREIYMVIVTDQTLPIIKNIITELIPKGNTIITDAVLCYNWLHLFRQKNGSLVATKILQ